MDGQIDSAVTQLREILKSAPKPDKLNGHPWVECLFVKHHVKGDRLLEKRRPGYQLASALAAIFMELQPDRPPESQKEKSRLNARWARFATLGAYFVPLLIEGSAPPPVTVSDIGARVNETIVELVTGKAYDQVDETLRTKYRLIYVSDQVSDAPVSRSTLNDWLQQGLAELAGRVLQREEELSLKHDQSSPLLELFGSEPAPVLIEQQPSAVEPVPSSEASEEPRHADEKMAAPVLTEQQQPIVEPMPSSPNSEVNQDGDKKQSAPVFIEQHPPTLEPEPSSQTSEANRPGVKEATDLQNVPLDHFVLIEWWVKERLRQSEPANSVAGLLDKAQRLAEFMAAIQLQIESGSEPTPRLVRQNVRRAMRGIGIAPEHDNTGDLLLDYLERAQILKSVDNYWEFSDPNLVDYFGARYISEYGQHWVSLRPRHRRLMEWAATCLARRGDDQRTRLFVADVRGALNHASDLSWLEVADIAAEFSIAQSPAIGELQERLIEALQRLAAIKSDRLRFAVAECGRRLGGDSGVTDFAEPVEEVIPPLEMERAADAMGLVALLHVLGVALPSGPDSMLVEDSEVVRALLEQLQKPGDEFQFPCAACLRRSSLQTKVAFNLDLKALWKSGAVSALEAIADIANDSRVDAFTQTLARSVLTRDDFILRVWALGEGYQPLVYTLLLALNKRLLFRTDIQQWQVVE